MFYFSYIAGGGIGNRSAAISSYIFDRSVYAPAKFVWETKGGSMSDSLPDTIWKNWDIEYTTTSTTETNSIVWYLAAKAASSIHVKQWWKTRILSDSIQEKLSKAPLCFDAAVTVRNKFNMCKEHILDINTLITDLKANCTETIYVSSDRYQHTQDLYKTLTMAGFNCFFYTDCIRLSSHDNEAGTINHDIWSVTEWYTLQRAKLIYKNQPSSTYTDFSEFVLKIPTKCINIY